MSSPAAALDSVRRVHIPALGWALLAGAAAAGGGLLVAIGSPVAIDIVLAGIGALGLARFGFVALIPIILLAPLDKPSMQWMVIIGGTTYLVASMRRLAAKEMTIPWILFALLAVATVDWQSSFSEFPTLRLLPIIKSVYLPPTSVPANEWLTFVFALVMMLLAIQLVRSLRQLQALVATILVASLWPLIDGVKQFAQGGYQPPQTITNAALVNPRSNYHAIQSVFAHPNPFGFYLAGLMIVTLVAIFEVKRPLWRWALIVVLGVSGFCFLNTYGRGAWIGFALAVLVLGIWRYRVLFVAGMIMLPIAAFAFPGAVRQVSNRFGDLASSSASHESNSLDWRRDQWSRMAPLGSEKPLTGQGFGSYQRLTIRVFGFEDNRFQTVVSGFPVGFTAHNDYVKTYVEMGWPGVILWIGALLGLIAAMVRAARTPGLRPWAICAGVIGIMAAEFSAGDNIQAGYSVVFLTLTTTLAGAVAGVAMWQRSENQPPRLGAAGEQGA